MQNSPLTGINAILCIHELVDLICSFLKKNKVAYIRFLSTLTQFIGAHQKLVKSILLDSLIATFASHNAFSKELDTVAAHNGKSNFFSLRNRLVDWSESSGEEQLGEYDYEAEELERKRRAEEEEKRINVTIFQKYSSSLDIEKIHNVLKELRKIVKSPGKRFSTKLNSMQIEHAIHKERMNET